jgi:Uma2 family endonuclease
MSDMSVLPERRLFTVEEYERMVEVGILGKADRVELIEGEIVQMTPINPPHLSVVARLNEFLVTRLHGVAITICQGPVRLFPSSMPEPDFAVLLPREDYYGTALPQPADVHLVIEVSDTSLRYDRDRKLPLYSSYGIRETWIVDIPHAQILVARSPRPDGYADIATIPRDGAISPEAFPDVVLEVRDILG